MDNLHFLQIKMRSCRACEEAGFSITPGAVFTGQTSARVMVIGQAPGITEVDAKRPFNAGSGRRLFEWLGQAGWDEADFRRQHYMTAVTKCYPGKSPSGRGDRVPEKAEQELCRPFLVGELTLVNPLLIIPVGLLAISLFFPKNTRLRDIIGRVFYLPADQTYHLPRFGLEALTAGHPSRENGQPDGKWLVPLPHPSGASSWPNQSQNRLLIQQAIQHLGYIREIERL